MTGGMTLAMLIALIASSSLALSSRAHLPARHDVAAAGGDDPFQHDVGRASPTGCFSNGGCLCFNLASCCPHRVLQRTTQPRLLLGGDGTASCRRQA